jgi:hypothetical protein
MAWSACGRTLLVALISHAVMRAWSLVDFVPEALAFERADRDNPTERSAQLDASKLLASTPRHCDLRSNVGGVRSYDAGMLTGMYI